MTPPHEVCAFHIESFNGLVELFNEKFRGIEVLIDGKFNLLAERINSIGNMSERIGELEERVNAVEKHVWKIVGALAIGVIIADAVLRHVFK